MDRFEELLKDLGRRIDIALHPDKNRVCKININNTLHVQLESEDAKERILIAAFIIEVPAGKFRENILKETLKSNYFFPRIGTFGYSERNNKLALFEYAHYMNMNGEKLAGILAQFIEKAFSWRNAIERGQPNPQNETGTKSDRSIFGLKT